MGKVKLRFILGPIVVVGALIFFAVSGFQEGKTYYKTIRELTEMGEKARGKRLKVAGTVEEGSIRRSGGALIFTLKQNDLVLPVRYTGSSPVPDTFKSGVEAVVEGKIEKTGAFEADKIQAKCASKYEPLQNDG